MAQKITEGNYSSFTTCYSLDAIEFEGEKLFIIETKYEGKTIGALFSEDSIDLCIVTGKQIERASCRERV